MTIAAPANNVTIDFFAKLAMTVPFVSDVEPIPRGLGPVRGVHG